MNPTLRRILVAGLGALAVTEKAARRLIDDLVAKGDITRDEGERVLGDLQRKWNTESGRLVEKTKAASQGLEQMITNALSKALDRAGIARKSELEELRKKVDGRKRSTARAASSSAKPKRSRKAAAKKTGSA